MREEKDNALGLAPTAARAAGRATSLHNLGTVRGFLRTGIFDDNWRNRYALISAVRK